MSTVDTKTDEAAGADDDEHVIDKENDTDAVDTADAADAAAEDGDGEAEAVKEIEENKSDNSVDDLDDDLDDDVGDDDQDDDDVDEDGDGEDNGNDEDNDGDDNKTETEKENDENRKKNSPPPTAELLIERPTKRSRTAYFIFADHMRPSIRKEVCTILIRCVYVSLR
jgi:ribonuclease E